MKKLIIFGTGYPIIIQHVLDITNSDNQYDIFGFVDDDESQWEKNLFGYPILGKLEEIDLPANSIIINNIYGSPKLRENINKRVYQFQDYIPSLIHPSVEARFSKVGEGCVIARDTYLGAGSTIGDHVAIRNTVFIGDHCYIGSYTFISDQTVVLGSVQIKQYSYIGANATILPKLELGENCVIGAGAVVTKHVPAIEIWAGNPAIFLKMNVAQF